MFHSRRRQVDAGCHRLLAVWVLAGAIVTGLVGCSDGDNGAIPATSTTTSRVRSSTTSTSEGTATTTTMGATIEQEIQARYIAYWDARFAANQAPPNPDFPGLADHATGDQLAAVVEETRRNLDEGLALRAREEPSATRTVRVVSVSGDEATVQECVVDDGIVYRFRSGEVVDDMVATHSVEGSMRRVDGVWKLARARLVQRWEGVAGCALAPQ